MSNPRARSASRSSRDLGFAALRVEGTGQWSISVQGSFRIPVDRLDGGAALVVDERRP